MSLLPAHCHQNLGAGDLMYVLVVWWNFPRPLLAFLRDRVALSKSLSFACQQAKEAVLREDNAMQRG